MSNLEDLHEMFCENSFALKGNSKETIKGYKRSFRDFIKYFQITDYKDLTQLIFERWLMDGKLKRNWKPKTIRIHMAAMSVFCDWLVQRKYLEENPIKNIPKPRLGKHLPKSLTVDQAMQLLDWAKHMKYLYNIERSKAYAIIGLFIFTGIRKKELLNLKLHDVDFQGRTLFVDGGKGDKDRIIPLNTRIIQILKPYIQQRAKRNPETPSFFISLRYNIPMGESALNRLVKKLRKVSGIPFSAHPLRHTFATLMLEGGCDIYSLSQMMGHNDIKTTTIYLSTTTAQLHKQAIKHPLNC